MHLASASLLLALSTVGLRESSTRAVFNVPTLLLLLFLIRKIIIKKTEQLEKEPSPSHLDIVLRLELLAKLLFMLEGNMAMLS